MSQCSSRLGAARRQAKTVTELRENLLRLLGHLAARSNDPALFACLDPFVTCLEANWGQKPNEKVRFGIWTIIAQGQKAKNRLSMERAIAKIDFNWGDSAYDTLKQLFRDISE